MAVIGGAGFDLAIDSQAEKTEVVTCSPGKVVRFQGDAATSCAIKDGPSMNLNVMTRRDGARRGSLSCHEWSAESTGLPVADVMIAMAPKTVVSRENESFALDDHGAVLTSAHQRRGWQLQHGSVAVVAFTSSPS